MTFVKDNFVRNCQTLKCFLLFVIAIIACLPCFSQVDLQAGLVACYSFSGNANDGTGHGHNGSISGATLTADRNGTGSSAYQFDGFNDYIEIPGQPFTNTNYSYSLWARASTLPGIGGVGNIFSIGDQTSKHQTVNFANVYGADGIIGINAGGFNNGSPATTSAPSGILPNIGQWYHIVATRNNSDMKLYVDGVLIKTTSTNMTTPYFGSPVTAVFGTRCNFTQYFNGAIDDVSIYDREITQDEVTELYQKGIACAPTIVHVDDIQSCTGGVFVIPATNGATYRWYDAEVGGNLLFEGNPFTTPNLQQTTTYYVSSYTNGVEGIRTKVVVRIFPAPELSCNFADTVFIDNSNEYRVHVSSGTAPFLYTFDFSDNTTISTSVDSVSHVFSDSGSFTISVNVIDINGCLSSCLSDVYVLEDNIFIPNVISPDNGDDLNQVFTLYIKTRDDGCVFYKGKKKFFMRIYNRWGKEVFVTENILSGWQGRDAAAGVYFFTIDFGGDRYKGWVHVLL